MPPAYSPVYAAGPWRIVSGQIGLTDGGLPAGFADQLEATLVNLRTRLSENGLRLVQVAKTTVFLTDMANYDTLNEIYTRFFEGHLPARSAVAVSGLPFDALVEIEAWVFTGD